MTKKEINSIKLKAIFAALNENFTIEEDFEDLEGHGYFTGIMSDALTNDIFYVDVMRRDFSIIVYQLHDEDKAACEMYQERLEEVIEEALMEAENQIQLLEINKGLGLA